MLYINTIYKRLEHFCILSFWKPRLCAKCFKRDVQEVGMRAFVSNLCTQEDEAGDCMSLKPTWNTW